jgi:hypothetical protein
MIWFKIVFLVCNNAILNTLYTLIGGSSAPFNIGVDRMLIKLW